MITDKDMEMIIATKKDIELANMLWYGSSEAAEDIPGTKDGTIEAIGWMAFQIVRIRAEAAEVARKEAADRAVEWVRSKGGYPYDERYEFDIDSETFEDELRAAILKEATE